MAKKEDKVVLENIELKPQVIGQVVKKKNNTGRVIIIFVAFILAILFLPDITLFLNNLTGKYTPSTIVDSKVNSKKHVGNTDSKEVVYATLNDGYIIDEDTYKVSNITLVDNKISFDITNKTDGTIDYSQDNYYLETYDDKKMLLERFKVDVPVIKSNGTSNISVDITNSNVTYIVFSKKNVDDYPVVDYEKDQNRLGSITCSKDNQTIIYYFNNDLLYKLEDKFTYSDVNNIGYSELLEKYQTRAVSYELLAGVKSAFNSSNNGFSTVIEVDLENANLKELDEEHYYKNETMAKVVSFEMQTYGYTCK
jgi:hypothetical protein